MSIGEFLEQVFEWLYQLWPFRIVKHWEQGVRLTGGKIRGPSLMAGVHWVYPYLGEIVIEDANLAVFETALQTVRLLDGTEVTFSLGVQWQIHDLAMMYSKIHDPDSSVAEACRGGAGRAALGFTDFASLSDGLEEAAAKAAREEMRGWGVTVRRVRLINLTTATPLRLIMDSLASHTSGEE